MTQTGSHGIEVLKQEKGFRPWRSGTESGEMVFPPKMVRLKSGALALINGNLRLIQKEDRVDVLRGLNGADAGALPC
jgi:hypothetical protein